MTKISVSILSTDLLNLEKEIRSIEESKADYIHVDVMDGHFVPNLTFGPDIVRQINQVSVIPQDVHLMISHPENYIERFASAGASIITVHYETCARLTDVLDLITRHGCKAGLAINPTTDVDSIVGYLDKVSLVLQMTVEPGFGGQAFIEETLDNITKLNQIRDEKDYKYVIEVDGGINKETGNHCINAGVDILVIGSYFINAFNRYNVISEFKQQKDFES